MLVNWIRRLRFNVSMAFIFKSTFLCLPKEKLQKKGLLAGAFSSRGRNVEPNRSRVCAATSHHAQYAARPPSLAASVPCYVFVNLPTDPKDDVQELLNQLSALDEGIGKFFAAEPVIEVPAAQDDDLIQSLNAIAKERRAADEMIIDEIKKVQLALQNESPPPQAALQTIMKIRDEIDFEALKEPINQLWLLFDKLNEILERHPMPDTQKGYERLIRRCKNFSRYVEQSLAMLGAEVINETDIPFDPAMHTIINGVRPTESSTVTKVLTVGLVYKGYVRRKANVEIAEPSGGDSQ